MYMCILLSSDIDECATDPTPCDPGTCNNVIDNFYTCTCEGGVRNNMGDATMGLLGCDGAYMSMYMQYTNVHVYVIFNVSIHVIV